MESRPLLNNNPDSSLLLSSFNNREVSAFSKIYLLYYNELHFFARKLFYNTEMDSEDVVQDVFVNVWEGKNRKFDTLGGLKTYLYVCIKNKFRNYLDHIKCVEEHRYQTLQDKDSFIVQIAESETLSQISKILDVLPEECAKVLRLHLEGWETKQIAEKLNKTESTVYKQKQEAIRILRTKYPKLYLKILPFLILLK